MIEATIRKGGKSAKVKCKLAQKKEREKEKC
jgi:hypothetical protein